MKTELILFHRPFGGLLSAVTNEVALQASTGSNYVFTQKENSNEIFTKNYLETVRPNGGTRLDLFDNIPIPVTYTILDIREPEKRKTNWSKTIRIPGSTNNNRIFSHIYEIGQDGWITIGNTSVYQGFNPNLKKEIIVLNDGIQVLKGNLQLKTITKNVNGDIEYEVALSGELTSLFYDVGNAKLSDLDWSEWDHNWTKDNVTNSWNGICVKDEVPFTSITSGVSKTISGVSKDESTGRLKITTSTPHGYSEEDWVKIDTNLQYGLLCDGEFQVADVISTTSFTVNYFYPVGLLITGYSGSLGTVVRRTASGRGYVYPMISWGDEYDENSFPVTSFVPGFYVKEIWDKIMDETKSTYQSDFLDSQFFKRLMIIHKRSSYDLTPSEWSSRKFWVATDSEYTTGASFRQCNQYYWLQMSTASTATASIFPSTNAVRTPFRKESGSSGTASFYDNGNNWNADTYRWVVNETGEYGFDVNVKASVWCDMNGYVNNTYNSTNGKTASYDGTASFPNPNSVRFYPTPFDATGPLFNGVAGAGPNNTGCGVRVIAEVKLLRNGQVFTIANKNEDFVMNASSYWTPTNTNWKYFGRYQPSTWENRNVKVPVTYYFKEGDEVWVETRYIVNSKPVAEANGRRYTASFVEQGIFQIIGEWFVRVENQSYCFNSPSPTSTEGSLIQAQSWLPKDMTCKDFLLSIIKSFNLHIEADKQVDRKYYIEPRDDFYKDGSSPSDFVDWTDKIDANSVKILPMAELTAKYYTFENKEESDYWNKRFKEDRGRAYMKYTKEIDNDFLKNEVKISTPLGSTVMINNPPGSDVVMPSIIQKEDNGSFKPVSNSAPRMLIWGGMRPYTAQRGGALIPLQNSFFPNTTTGWELLSSVNVVSVSSTASTYLQYPYAGTVDSPHDPINDINWYNMEDGDFVYWDLARWTNANLYNKYWSNFINEISDPASKVVTCDVLLQPTDLFELDFRKIYVIDGHWLRLQKILDYDPIGDGLTKCEFLKLKSPTRFRRQSIIVDSYGIVNNNFVTTVDTTRPVVITDVQVAPSRKRPDFGFNNGTPAVSVSNNSTVRTNGNSNYVAPGASNVSITGNENSVGNGAINVNISGGDGNFISGGSSNVNMIGTSKKYVNESDVTYINGVRYKNGVAISRANVIDGGSDTVVVRQSESTTSNVIDGSEDVVISSGSNNYENVVDSGIDTILPDVPELGVGTLVNPNPRTNLTGGYDITTNTKMVDIVRDRAFTR